MVTEQDVVKKKDCFIKWWN